MTGEMTRKMLNEYPDMIALKKTLRKNGFDATMSPFDVYQGPYIFINGFGHSIWYAELNNPRSWLLKLRNDDIHETPLTSRGIIKFLKQERTLKTQSEGAPL